MSPEGWGAILIGVIGLVAAGAFASHRNEQARLGDLRTLAAASMFLRNTWEALANIPASYLPASVRQVLGKAMQLKLAEAQRVDANHPHLQDNKIKIQEMMITNPPPERELLAPDQRPVVRASLRMVKRICVESATSGGISVQELQQTELVLDTLMGRLLVDLLKHSAANAENLRNFEEASVQMAKAIEELDKLTNVDVSAEKAEMQRHMDVMRQNVQQENQVMLSQAAQAMEDNVSDSILKRGEQYD